MRLEVLGKLFTRATLKAELRIIRDCYQPGEFITDKQTLSFLNECLRQGNIANDKAIEAGDIKWFVARNLYESLCFGILRENGTFDYPSLDRLSGKKKPAPRPKDAARFDIAYQINEFKGDRCGAQGIFTCEECGFSADDVRQFEAHHHGMPFTELWDTFVSLQGLIESDIEITKREPEKVSQEPFSLAYPLNFAWQAFHRKYAQLKLLCGECHARLTYARPAGEAA